MIFRNRQFQYTDGEKMMRATKWAYKTTTFKLLKDNTKSKKEIYSVIFDKELNYQKSKSIVDVKANNISLKLLKRVGIK